MNSKKFQTPKKSYNNSSNYKGNITKIKHKSKPKTNNSLSAEYLKNKNKSNLPIINYNNNKIILQKSFSFTPYLSSKDLKKYDQDLTMEEKTFSLHSQKINYLPFHQEFDIKKRYILLSWLMEICSQISFLRSTYYLCLNLIDLYFSKNHSLININEFQLVGISCLLIAAKNEEPNLFDIPNFAGIPVISIFSYLCDGIYSSKQILNGEKIILKELKWKIQFPNLNEWANKIIYKWDLFVDENDLIEGGGFYKFKKDIKFNNKICKIYFQILDLITLDYYYNFIHERNICLGILFFLIGIVKGIFSFREIGIFNVDHNAIFYDKTSEQLKQIQQYQKIVFYFGKNFFGTKKNEIIEGLNYTCQFFGMNFINLDNKENYNNEIKREKNEDNEDMIVEEKEKEWGIEVKIKEEKKETKKANNEENLDIQIFNENNISDIERILNKRYITQ